MFLKCSDSGRYGALHFKIKVHAYICHAMSDCALTKMDALEIKK